MHTPFCVSSFACPRLSASPIQPCPPPRAIRLRAAVGVRRSAPFAFAQARASASASPRAGRAQAAPRCWAAPTRAERVAALRASVGVRARHPAASAFCERCVFALTPFAGVALRAKSAAARLAPLAPRRVRLRLTPAPRSRRRAIPPLHLPSHRAQRRSDSTAILPLQPPCPCRFSLVKRLRRRMLRRIVHCFRRPCRPIVTARPASSSAELPGSGTDQE